MYILELILFTFLLFVLFNVILIPLGHILSKYLLPKQSDQIQLLCSFAFSLLIYSGIAIALVFLGCGNTVIAWVLDSIILGSLGSWFLLKLHKKLINGECLFIYLIVFLYLLLTSFFTAFPELNFRDVSAALVEQLSGAPVDNLIPYNIARYITNRIGINVVEVVPDWQATDRGPLAGIFTAVLFIVLGIQDNGPWLMTAPGKFFCYQTLNAYLNLLSLISVWLVGAELFGKRSAVFSVLLLVTMYFYFLNIYFTWPKFLMAYFILCSMCLYQKGERPVLIGGFWGGAMLSHDSAMFVPATIVLYEGIIALKRAWPLSVKLKFLFEKLKPFVVRVLSLFLGYFLVTGPWSIFKILFSKSSRNLLYLHLFCDIKREAVNMSFFEALKWYLKHNPLDNLLVDKIKNIFYPFNPFTIIEVVPNTGIDIFHWFNSISLLVFFQFIWGIGPFIFVLLLLAVFSMRKDREIRDCLPMLIAGFVSIILAAISFGCKNTAYNHVCGYPAFLITGVLVGRVLDKFGLWASIVGGIGVTCNAILAILFVHFHPIATKPFIHGSFSYVISQVVIIIMLAVTFLFSFWFLDLEKNK